MFSLYSNVIIFLCSSCFLLDLFIFSFFFNLNIIIFIFLFYYILLFFSFFLFLLFLSLHCVTSFLISVWASFYLPLLLDIRLIFLSDFDLCFILVFSLSNTVYSSKTDNFFFTFLRLLLNILDFYFIFFLGIVLSLVFFKEFWLTSVFSVWLYVMF